MNGMTVAPPDRLRRDLVDLVHRGGDVRDFSLKAARLINRAVPFDGVCVLTMDPATFLPTGEVSDNALPLHVRARLAQLEISGDDVNSFGALIRSGRQVATLGQATDGHLERSLRHRELRAPNGFGDELRAVLFSDGVAWGGLSLLRASDRGHFAPADAALLESVAGYLAEGLRRAILLTSVTEHPHEDEGHAGLVLLAADGSVVTTDAAAEVWLSDLGEGHADSRVPEVVAAVAARAQSLPELEEPRLARARVRTGSGNWLIVRGSVLSGDGHARTAVTIEPARPHDLAPLIADAYGLTERERAVTQLVTRGLDTEAIGRRLYISPWTVQDHLKAIFEKVGVSTRGELVARMFFEHYAPRLSERAPIGRDGWFESWPGREAAPRPERDGGPAEIGEPFGGRIGSPASH